MSIRTKRNSRRFIAAAAAVAVAASTFAVSNSPVSAVTPISPTTYRLSGADRYETATEIARAYGGTLGANGLVVASGESPYDALAASSLAGLIDAPLVLVKKDSVPDSVVDLLADNIAGFNSSAQKVYIVGGTAAISQEVEDAITALVHTGKLTASQRVGIVRIAGTDRYDTAKKITEVAGLTLAADRMILVNGDNDRWADALSVSNIAAKNKWPIVTTSNGGLNATAKAVIDAYLAKPGSAKKFLIVGGPAVMPTSIETYLDSKAVPLANIDRRGGVDRYQTNFLLNLYALPTVLGGGNAAPAFNGVNVAIATGLSPWDALAAGPWAANENSHLVLTQPTALNPNAVGLAGALTAAGLPTNLRVIGGTTAVPNAIRSAFIATSQSSNIAAPTLSGCTVGSSTVTITFPKRLSAAEAATFEQASQAWWTKNGLPAGSAVGAPVSVSGAVVLGATPANLPDGSTYVMTVSPPLASTNTIAFLGISEGAANAGNFKRSVAGASCTVAADAVAPVVTGLKVVVDAANTFDYMLVTLSEPVTTSSVASLSAGTYWSAATTSSQTAAQQLVVPGLNNLSNASLSASAVPGSSNTIYKVSLSATATPVSLSAGSVVTLAKEAIVDRAGLTAAANATGTAAQDVVAPTMSIAAVACATKSNASFTRGSLTITAKGAAAGGTAHGVAGNAWRLTVVNNRGLVMPSIAVDSTAKTIVVTMDTTYHSGADIAALAANLGVDGDWGFSGASDKTVTATVTAAAPTTLGVSTCAMTVAFSEPGFFTVTGTPTPPAPALTVNGLSTAIVSGANTGIAALSVGARVQFDTTQTGSVLLAATVSDAGTATGTAATARTATGTIG